MAAAASGPAAVGNPAPDFSLPDDSGQTVSLADCRGRNTVLFFYPQAMTAGCTREVCAFRDSLASFNQLDAVGAPRPRPCPTCPAASLTASAL